LQPTALVNEAWLKMQRASKDGPQDPKYLLKIAGTVMRQVLVDHARRKGAVKRTRIDEDGHQELLDLLLAEYERRSGGLLQLDIALERLADQSPESARLVELRFFAGCTTKKAAEALGWSERDAGRRWKTVKAMLKRELDL
ncbi:MAG: ECF-type sigma factor, partial [Planctomycetota bacterium]